MKVEVKSIISPDVIDFKNYYPKDDKSFSFLLEFVVGINGKDGGDIFSIEVCTPKWLSENNNCDTLIFGRGKLIVLEYDIQRIFKRIKDYCESITGDTWEEIANKISRVGLWEFEDYQIKA